MSIGILVGGTWAHAIGPWGDLTFSSEADGGDGQASWNMQLPAGFKHPALRRGQRVEVRAGSYRLFTGILAEPDDSNDGWALHADGMSTLAAGYLCLDGTGDTTSTPDTAIDQAIARGLPWTRPTSISNAAFATSGSTDNLNYLSDLLDAYAQSVSKRWGVDQGGAVFLRADPTTPSWHITPGTASFGLADDDYASDIYLRYYTTTFQLATAHVQDATAAARFGTKEYAVDGTNYGALTAAQAAANAQGLLDRGKARLGWTESVSPSRWQITTPGGAPAWPPLVRAGDMVRLHGIRNEQGQPTPYVDFVIGEATYSVGDGSLTVAPVGMAERTLSDVLAVT